MNENDCGEALVGLDGMQRANSTLEDFVSTSPSHQTCYFRFIKYRLVAETCYFVMNLT